MNFIKPAVLTILLSFIGFNSHAQFMRTSFVMNDSHYRMKINPALVPDRGYFDVPLLSNLNVGVNSNSLGFQDIIDAFGGNSEGNYLSDKFFNNLKDVNRMSFGFGDDLISFGLWKGENFLSFSAGLRIDIGVQAPRSMFNFIREMESIDDIDWGNYRIDIGNERFSLNVYSELGVGIARNLSDNLSVGGKFKFLLGMGNIDVRIDDIRLQTSNLKGDVLKQEGWANGGSASLEVAATLESSLAGMELEKDRFGYIENFKYNGFGIAGYGAAIDFGVTYKAFDNFTLSASLTDLGFISWSSSSTNIFTAETSRYYTEENYQDFVDIIENEDLLNYNLFGFQHDEQNRARSTSLYSTLSFGGEYSFLNDIFSLGLLSTTRMLKPATISEVTLAFGARPTSSINLGLSYSLIQSGGRTIGFGAKLGPLFFGTDYMMFNSNSTVFNAFAGISIPLSAKN
jgi:hypothetical protein